MRDFDSFNRKVQKTQNVIGIAVFTQFFLILGVLFMLLARFETMEPRVWLSVYGKVQQIQLTTPQICDRVQTS